MSAPDREAAEAIGSSERRRALVIVNPYATAVTPRLRDVVLTALAARYELEAIDTRARGHATELSLMAASGGYDVVVTFGGDGTVNEVANGLAGTSTPLTPLPGGSANVFCKLLGIPAEIVDATEHLLSLADRFEPRRVALGHVEGRHYTFSAGIGIDASVVRLVDSHPARKRRFGPSFFLASALWTFVRRYLHDPPRLRLAVAGEAFEGITAIVQNGEHYTYFNDRPIDLAPGASLDGGTLSGVVLRRGALRDAPSLLAGALLPGRGVTAHRQVDAFADADAVTIASLDGRPLPLQLDGDFIGEITETRFEVRPGALAVIA